MKSTALIALIMLTACSHRPHYQRDILADIIARDAYDRKQTQVTIVDRDVALRQLDMPTCHFKGC